MHRRTPSARVLADLELLRSSRRLPVDRARLVAVDVVAQGVELARTEALGLRHQVPAEHAVPSDGIEQLERLRGDHDLGRAGPDAPRHGEAELVAALDLERAEREHAAPRRPGPGSRR